MSNIIKELHGDYRIQDNDYILVYNGPEDISPYVYLPSATGSKSVYIVRNLIDVDLVVCAEAPDTIEGETSFTVVQYETVVLLDFKTGLWIKI